MHKRISKIGLRYKGPRLTYQGQEDQKAAPKSGRLLPPKVLKSPDSSPLDHLTEVERSLKADTDMLTDVSEQMKADTVKINEASHEMRNNFRRSISIACAVIIIIIGIILLISL